MALETRIAGQEYQSSHPFSIDSLLQNFDPESVRFSQLLKFKGVTGRHIYNNTAPFEDNGRLVVSGRIEHPQDEFDYETGFFAEKRGSWSHDKDLPTFKLQDPFVTRIDGELIFGGVRAWRNDDNSCSWETELWRGHNLSSLEYWMSSPPGNKGFRIFKYFDKYGFFSRPEGDVDRYGKVIRCGIVESLDDINYDAIMSARPIQGMFANGEWGGVNAARQLPNGLMGVFGHVARYEPDRSRSYYGMAFQFDPIQWLFSDYHIVAGRSQFPAADPKRPELANVVYSGDWVSTDTTDIIYVGCGDSVGAMAYVDRLHTLN